jgi:hypothetical protein
MAQYEVIVGGTRTVYRGGDKAMAGALYSEHSHKRRHTVLLRDGQPLLEAYGNMGKLWAVSVGGTRLAKERWPRRVYKSKAAAKRRIAQIHAAHDLGVATIGLVHVDHGDAMTERRARVIGTSSERYERAREVHDPKRYKRGGGYTPEESRAIAKRAGISRRPSNKALSKLEVYEFIHNPPDKVFAYYDKSMTKVTTWMGDKLGDIIWRGQQVQRWNYGRTQAIRVRGVNGVMYAGHCNLTGGTYCRLRRMSGTRSR